MEFAENYGTKSTLPGHEAVSEMALICGSSWALGVSAAFDIIDHSILSIFSGWAQASRQQKNAAKWNISGLGPQKGSSKYNLLTLPHHVSSDERNSSSKSVISLDVYFN